MFRLALRFLSVLLLLVILNAQPAKGDLLVLATPHDTAGRPDLTTWVITFDVGAEWGYAIDATFTAGTVNQLNPAGLPTVFQDHNPDILAAGGLVDQDSQFYYQSTDVVYVDARESSSLLAAAFAWSAATLDFHRRDVAQVVVPDDAVFTYYVELAVGTNLSNMRLMSAGGTFGPAVPEPAAGLALGGLAAAGLVLKRRRGR